MAHSLSVRECPKGEDNLWVLPRMDALSGGDESGVQGAEGSPEKAPKETRKIQRPTQYLKGEGAMKHDQVLDTATIGEKTLRGWLEGKVAGYRKQANALRDDAGTQAEPEAKIWEAKAETVKEVMADIEKVDWPVGHIMRLSRNPEVTGRL